MAPTWRPRLLYPFSYIYQTDSQTAFDNYLIANATELKIGKIYCSKCVRTPITWTSMPQWISLRKSRSWMTHSLKVMSCTECLQKWGKRRKTMSTSSHSFHFPTHKSWWSNLVVPMFYHNLATAAKDDTSNHSLTGVKKHSVSTSCSSCRKF